MINDKSSSAAGALKRPGTVSQWSIYQLNGDSVCSVMCIRRAVDRRINNIPARCLFPLAVASPRAGRSLYLPVGHAIGIS